MSENETLTTTQEYNQTMKCKHCEERTAIEGQTFCGQCGQCALAQDAEGTVGLALALGYSKEELCERLSHLYEHVEKELWPYEVEPGFGGVAA